MNTKITLNGQTFDMDAVRNLMDDEICEQIHGTVETEQEFVDRYVELHAAKFNGEQFRVN